MISSENPSSKTYCWLFLAMMFHNIIFKLAPFGGFVCQLVVNQFSSIQQEKKIIKKLLN